MKRSADITYSIFMSNSNIIFIMAVKIGFLFLGAGAVIGMQEAIFADVGVALIAIFNSMRILKKIKQKKQ